MNNNGKARQTCGVVRFLEVRFLRAYKVYFFCLTI